MVGEPCPESVGQKLEQLVVVLAGAAALPRGLGRDQLPDHSRLSAHPDSDFRQRQRTSIPIPVGFRLSALRLPVSPQLPCSPAFCFLPHVSRFTFHVSALGSQQGSRPFQSSSAHRFPGEARGPGADSGR